MQVDKRLQLSMNEYGGGRSLGDDHQHKNHPPIEGVVGVVMRFLLFLVAFGAGAWLLGFLEVGKKFPYLRPADTPTDGFHSRG